VGAGRKPLPPSLPSRPLPGSETFQTTRFISHPESGPKGASSRQRICSCGKEQKFKTRLCLYVERAGDGGKLHGWRLKGDGQSVLVLLEGMKFCLDVVVGSGVAAARLPGLPCPRGSWHRGSVRMPRLRESNFYMFAVGCSVGSR